jgi:hypothetical protein
MAEFLPIACGVLIGVLFGVLRPESRRIVCGLAALAAGVLATIVSGEYRLSWAFLLVDIPLVVVAAVATDAVSGRVMRRVRAAPGEPS